MRIFIFVGTQVHKESLQDINHNLQGWRAGVEHHSAKQLTSQRVRADHEYGRTSSGQLPATNV